MVVRARFVFAVPSFLLTFFLLFLDSAQASVIDRAKEAGLLPHRAMYDIRLASKKSGSQVINITGKMVYEWQPSCDVWISNHKFDLTYEYADAPGVKVESDFSAYETFDGKGFNFTSQRKTNGQVFEELRGAASLDEPREAVYSIPDGLTFDLPEDALFPMAHTLTVLEKLRAGKKFFSAVTFDGSDKEGPVEINTFMGKAANVPDGLKSVKEIDQDFLKSKAWNIRLAFFPMNRSESEADYEMDIIFHENGVISDMMIDYGKFSVSQKLTALEPMPDACQSGGFKADPKSEDQ
jgi:EipB-like